MKPYIEKEDATTTLRNVLESSWKRATELFGISKDTPKLYIRKFGYRIVARAYSHKNKIEFNENFLYSRDISKDALTDTIVHEVCHILNSLLYYGSGHNASWKKLCRAMGCNDSATCALSVPDNSNGFAVECACGMLHRFGRKPRLSRYRCKCGVNLGFAKVVRGDS